MASPVIFPSGLNLAGTVFANGPATLQLGGPVYFSGGVQWLDTINGNNANAGTLPELPVATFDQAVTNSAANGAIVIGQGSAESLAVAQTINLAGLSIFGCGIGSSRPRYTCTGAVSMWDVTAAGVWIEGIYFPASQAAATNRVAFTSDSGVVKDCYFECGANDTNRALRLHTGADDMRVEGCSFVTTALRPAVGLEISAAVVDPRVFDCTFDGGSYGWTDYALKVSAAATRIVYSGLTLVNRSDIGHTVTGTTYKIFGPQTSGQINIHLTA